MLHVSRPDRIEFCPEFLGVEAAHPESDVEDDDDSSPGGTSDKDLSQGLVLILCLLIFGMC